MTMFCVFRYSAFHSLVNCLLEVAVGFDSQKHATHVYTVAQNLQTG